MKSIELLAPWNIKEELTSKNLASCSTRLSSACNLCLPRASLAAKDWLLWVTTKTELDLSDCISQYINQEKGKKTKTNKSPIFIQGKGTKSLKVWWNWYVSRKRRHGRRKQGWPRWNLDGPHEVRSVLY